VRTVLAGACIGALIPLAWLDPHQRQLPLYFSWLAAMVLYLLQWRRPRGVIRWHPSPWLLAGLGLYGLTLFALFCEVYGNWRWALTGDSLYFYGIGEELARGNPAIGWLNVVGVFEQATVVQATLQNAFMHIWPTLFGHRLGNLLTSTMVVGFAALLAGETSGATAAVLLGLFLPLNRVFATFALISYPNLSGVLPYYAAYALFMVAWRVRHSDFLWAALGLACGLALYFAPLWLGAVAIVSALVVLFALRWRSPRAFVIWAGGGLVAGLPALLQLPNLLHVWLIFRPTYGLSPAYVAHLAWQTASLPFSGELDAPWVTPPFGALIVAGALLAAASGIAALRRRPRGRTLRHAWIWLALVAVDVVGLSLANSGYPSISLKRAIVLLPSLTFLLIVPLAWLSERVGRAWFTVVLAFATFVPYAYLNAMALWQHEAGFNIGDGLVRMVQTAPTPILLVSPHPDLEKMFGQHPDPGGQADSDLLMQRLYHLRDHIIVRSSVPSERSEFNRVVCFSEHFDGQEWTTQVRNAMARLCPNNPVQRITGQLECVTCDPDH